MAYLRDRLETRQSARRLASELDPLTALARSIRRALIPRRDLPVLDAYLVDRGRVGEFVALVAELGDCLDGVELVCTGPCPPYSFADGGRLPRRRHPLDLLTAADQDLGDHRGGNSPCSTTPGCVESQVASSSGSSNSAR